MKKKTVTKQIKELAKSLFRKLYGKDSSTDLLMLLAINYTCIESA